MVSADGISELLAWAGVDSLVRSTHRSLSVEEVRALASSTLSLLARIR